MSFIKTAFSKILSQKVLAPAASRFIFVYHDVSEPGSPQYSDLYSTDTEIFKEQIDFLKENFEIVSLDEILSAPESKKRLAAITFDDGFLSVKETAMPYLTKRNIPFTVFLNSTAIEENYLPYDQFDEINRKYGQRVYLNADEVKSLGSEPGVIIGSHTANHKTIGNCDEETLHTEVLENKNFLENLTGSEVAHLAIPYGKREHYNQAALDYCKKAGHKFIYSTNPVYFKGAWPENEAKPIPRIGLTNQTAAELCFLINRPIVKKIDI